MLGRKRLEKQCAAIIVHQKRLQHLEAFRHMEAVCSQDTRSLTVLCVGELVPGNMNDLTDMSHIHLGWA